MIISNVDFSIKGEPVFYYKDSYISLCPCCGKKLDVEIPSGQSGDKINDRIAKRCLTDNILEQKIQLLSEIYFWVEKIYVKNK